MGASIPSARQFHRQVGRVLLGFPDRACSLKSKNAKQGLLWQYGEVNSLKLKTLRDLPRSTVIKRITSTGAGNSHLARVAIELFG